MFAGEFTRFIDERTKVHSNGVEGGFGQISQWKQKNKCVGRDEESFCNYYGMFNLWRNWGGESIAANFWIILWILLYGFSHAFTPDDPTLGHSWGNSYEVGKILSKKSFRNKTLYLIKWKNCSLKKSTWEPSSHVPTGIYFYFLLFLFCFY